MQHIYQIVREWRSLIKKLRPDSMLEPEWRFGTLTQTGFTAGVSATDFQTIAKKLMATYQSDSATTTDQKQLVEQKDVRRLGKIVRVEEWHLEDMIYAGGFRARQAKLTSSLPNGTNATNGQDVTHTQKEFIQKQRVMWSDMRALQRKYDGRFGLKMERTVAQSGLANAVPEQRRMQTRRSFSVENYLKIELSIVQQQSLSSSSKSPLTRYEVEMELLPLGAQQLSDQQIVAHIWNWTLEILDSLGKTATTDTTDGPLLFVRLKPNEQNPSSVDNRECKAICADTMLVAVTREISRIPNLN